MASTWQNVITVAPGAPWDPGTYSAPHSTVSGSRFEIDPNATFPDPKCPAIAFQNAYNALPLSGGTLEVWPGTAPYFIDNQVVFRRKPVTVIQHSGSNIAHDALFAASAFRITCRLIWKDLFGQYDVVEQVTPNRSLFLISALDLVQNNSGGAAVVTIDTSAKTLTRNEGSFINDGCDIGDYCYLSGYGSANNNGAKLITAVTDLVVTYRDALSAGTTGQTGTMYYANNAAMTRFMGGVVSLAPGAAGIQHYSVFNAVGISDIFDLPGLKFKDIDLHIRNARRNGAVPTQATSGWITPGVTPSGIGLVRTKWCRQVDVGGCRLIGQANGRDETAGFTQYHGCFIWHEDTVYSTYHELLAAHSDSTAADSTGTPFIYCKPGPGEGGHLNISNVFAEHCGFSHGVEVDQTAWIHINLFRMGRMQPCMTSAFKAVNAGKTLDITFSGTHNCPGPSSGTAPISVTVSGTTITTGAINLLKNLKADDRFRMEGWTGANAANNRIYTIASVGPTSIVTTEAPPVNATANVVLTMQAWVGDFEGVQDMQLYGNNNTFRKSDAPPYRFKDCKDVRRDPNEPIDSMATQRFP